MCLISFAIQACSRWPLVIAANRDEFFDRPTLPLSLWQSAGGQQIVSGRDVRAGGTWLGMTPQGRIAMLTNVRELAGPLAARSRGELVTRWLEGRMNAVEFMAQTDPTAYGGFNLVVGDFQQGKQGRWSWLSNRFFGLDSAGQVSARAETDGWRFRTLEPGVYTLSNAALDTPWPKSMALKADLNQALDSVEGDTLENMLWHSLQSRQGAGGHELPDTGLPRALEELLSSAFVSDPARAYSTRCSTVVTATSQAGMESLNWALNVAEKTWRLPAPHEEQIRLVDMVRHNLQWRREGQARLQ